MADEVRLRRTLQHIQNNPLEWDQRYWRSDGLCGSAYCFAGWALVLEDIEICNGDCTADPDLHGSHVHHGSLTSEMQYRLGTGWTISGSKNDERLHSVSVAARQILGLKVPQAYMLFCASNTLADLERLVNEYTSVAGGGGAGGD